MKFANLNLLWLLWLIPLLGFYFVTSLRGRRQLLAHIISPNLWKEMMPGLREARLWIKLALFFVGMAFVIMSLLRPQWGYELREVRRKGVDIFVLVDVSQSMKAEDVSPSRIERAKRELIDLTNYLKGDRIGLIPFAGKPYVASPLTTDYDAFSLFISQLDTDLVTAQGTHIAAALTKALKTFEPGENRAKAIIMITDGEATEGGIPAVIEQTKKENVRIYVIGIGSDKGAPVPELDGSGFKKDERGELVISRLDEGSLKKLATETGGSYVRSVTGDMDLEQIYLKGIKQDLEDRDLKSGKKRIPEERFQIPLAIALIFLLAEILIRETSKKEEA